MSTIIYSIAQQSTLE